jgi:2-polyprenyl-3-methyl-5-hydroxy-6-metoxy-1,4-benzoquinol methylase
MPIVPHEIEWTTEKSKRLWDYYGSNPKYATAFFGYIAGRFAAKMLFADVKPVASARFLDFSCGWGDVIAACLERMCDTQEIYATDFSDTYVQHVTDRFKNEQRFKGAVLTKSLPCPYADASFDVIIATEVIEHLLDHELEGMLGECRRLLKPGGRVFFTTPNDEDYDASKTFCPECGCIFHRWQHVRTWTAETLRQHMDRLGFTTRLVKPVAWQAWYGKLKSLVLYRRIDKNGLIYIGERTN